MPAPAPRLAPRKPSSSESWKAERVFVPSVTIAAVNPATPGRSAGSRAAPASSITSWKATMGRRWYSTSRTERPLPSRNFCWAGSFRSGAMPSGGTLLPGWWPPGSGDGAAWASGRPGRWRRR